jgi:tRNA (cmo5U34)-methyltransferase
MSTKSTVEDIRRRFDGDVDRFSNLQTGQSATIDAPLVLDLVTEAAAATTPHARAVLDVGCGAGNYTLKLLQRLPDLDVTLLDLSRPMLDRAAQRVSEATKGRVTAIQDDVREADLSAGKFDVILAAAVLHHLRADAEWKAVFTTFHRCLRPGGSVWISDLVQHENPAVHAAMWRRYGEYLVGLKGEAYRDEVYGYVDREDTPRSLTFQMDLLRKTGFVKVDVLHKNLCFAAFGGLRSRRKAERE